MLWVPDPAHSAVGFAVKHMMISTARGQFDTYGGKLELDEAHPERSVIEGWVETASLDSGNDMRDNHLRSADFFDVEKYPRMTFRSTRIEPLGDNRFNVVGDLTIKDITREIVFDTTFEGQVIDIFGVERGGFTALATLNRSEWGLTWNMPLAAGGWAVSEQVRVTIEMEAIPQRQLAAAAKEAEAEAKIVAH